MKKESWPKLFCKRNIWNFFVFLPTLEIGIYSEKGEELEGKKKVLQEVKRFFRKKILLNRTYIRDKYERKSAKRKDEKFNGGQRG